MSDAIVISLTFTMADVEGMVDEWNENNPDQPIPLATAIARAQEWGRHIQSTASELCAEQLYSAITTGQP